MQPSEPEAEPQALQDLRGCPCKNDNNTTYIIVTTIIITIIIIAERNLGEESSSASRQCHVGIGVDDQVPKCGVGVRLM